MVWEAVGTSSLLLTRTSSDWLGDYGLSTKSGLSFLIPRAKYHSRYQERNAILDTIVYSRQTTAGIWKLPPTSTSWIWRRKVKAYREELFKRTRKEVHRPLCSMERIVGVREC
jgi:hypothetical protein